jgi:hypothetical protein
VVSRLIFRVEPECTLIISGRSWVRPAASPFSRHRVIDIVDFSLIKSAAEDL